MKSRVGDTPPPELKVHTCMNVAQLTFNKLLFSTATAIARERHAEGDYYNNIGLYYLFLFDYIWIRIIILGTMFFWRPKLRLNLR